MGRISKAIKMLRLRIVRTMRIRKNFSNMNLSNIDLSKVDPKYWEGAIFYNTNFSNTGIRFNPERLWNESIEKCNFENVDLSYIEEKAWRWISITDANLRNTGARIDLTQCYNKGKTLGAVKLDKETLKFYCNDNTWIDFETLRANPFIIVSFNKILELIDSSIKHIPITDKKRKELVEQCESYLKEFDNGEITNLYEQVCRNFTYLDKIKFFKREVKGKLYEDLTISEISVKVLQGIYFSNCIVKKIKVEGKLKYILDLEIPLFEKRYNNSLQSIEFSDLNLDSWKYAKPKNNTMGIVTFRSFLYLEIGMKCNCNCKFCRNKSFDGKCNQRDINRVIHNLYLIKDYVNTIFIGGGESTYYIDDIIRINKEFDNVVVITNGAIEKDTLNKLRENHISIYMSRHAISEDENRSILNPPDKTNILSLGDIKKFAHFRKTSFTPVCVKGGLDSPKKVKEYIKKSFKCEVDEILFSTLQEDASTGTKVIDYEDLYVDPNIFNEVFSYLLIKGFKQKRTICSTGGYILKIFKNERKNRTVSFKIYISKEQFKEQWKNCVKKTFDFTMTSNGDIYQDWCRDTLVDLRKLR